MQQGVPSLSSPFPEYERILKEHPVGKTCHCNPTAIASALNDMLDNEIEYNHMVKECERAAEEFHWQHEEKKLIQLYHGL
jgi:glycosyltransferase involved in cell wall biosynthesis